MLRALGRRSRMLIVAIEQLSGMVLITSEACLLFDYMYIEFKLRYSTLILLNWYQVCVCLGFYGRGLASSYPDRYSLFLSLVVYLSFLPTGPLVERTPRF